ncbi:hypothetical protein SRABI118_02903 [Massilia sp. Bi118]|uniref:DNRLRE domain-containing protein n=1 Tax=Massilia sp. Bi118 TaxID=2822346 RepID=UPI001D695965|nr:DNRLRE domain-containing protein [Massilia sp. Bi118]CAH0248440.1 hypothetical protein SRABI118_02903 [Massilia sp. Bi118]
MIRRTDGFLLLPVALTLVAVGAMAYAMTRDAGMNVTNVDAEYDIEVARYLAESAVNLARWNNNKTNCDSHAATFNPTSLYRYNLAKGSVGTTAADLVGTMTLNGISVVGNNSNNDKNSITVDVSSATTATPAGSQRIVRTVYRYNLTNLRTTTISGNGAGANTTISTTNTTPQGTMAYMELTDNGLGDQSYGLLRFNLTALPRNALVRDATLRLKRISGEFTPLSTRQLDIQRITSAWDPETAVWSLPWSKPGGDVATVSIDSSLIGLDGYYYFPRLDALVAGWMDGTLPNNGVLLKPTNLNKSRFAAFTSGDSDGPQLTVNYYERCN